MRSLLARTAPYMHDGSLATLGDVERRALVTFLLALTGDLQ